MTALIFHPIYSQLNLPDRHRFPIQKYQGLYDRLISGGVSQSRFVRPKALLPDQVKGPLCPHYVDQFVTGELDPAAMRRIGFPWSEQLVVRSLTAVAGTILAGVLALQTGRALNLTGGYHHGFYDYGSGYCILNDLYLCALNMLEHHSIERVLIFDCDVHQGDGTARLAQGDNRIITVSIHGESNFPFRKQVSDEDVSLARGVEDDEYLESVNKLLRRVIANYQPQAVIYDAGVDIHARDELGHFNISTEGVLARDKLVFEQCDRAGLPVAAVIGGGYQRDIPALVDVHYQLFKAALNLE